MHMSSFRHPMLSAGIWLNPTLPAPSGGGVGWVTVGEGSNVAVGIVGVNVAVGGTATGAAQAEIRKIKANRKKRFIVRL